MLRRLSAAFRSLLLFLLRPANGAEPRSAEGFARLIAAQVPAAPVRDLTQVMHDPHLEARGALRHLEHPQYGPIIAAASPLRFDGTVSLPEPPSVPLNHDGREILMARLGMAAAEADRLLASGDGQ